MECHLLKGGKIIFLHIKMEHGPAADFSAHHYIYELMGCLNFLQYIRVLEVWREKKDSDGNSHLILESYISLFLH